MVYDVVVIGMGPAGSTAALHAASSGLTVLGLDRASFPRYKACGGGLSPKILKLIDVRDNPSLERSITGLRLSFLSRKKIFRFEEPISFMVMREVFDEMLVNRAVEKGALFNHGVKVCRIEEQNDGILVHSEIETFKGRIAIGADGALGLTARHLNPRLSLRNAPGIEGEFCGPEDIDPSTIEFEVGHTPSGYGWIFPKKERCSIGVATFRGNGSVKNPYREYLSAIFKEKSRPERESGYPIPVYSSPGLKLASKRLLLTGDAGHLVDPFFGEGIYYAMRSGEIAGNFSKKMLDQGVSPSEYQREIEREFYPEFRAAKNLARLVYRFPKLFFDLTDKHPGVIRQYAEVLNGRRLYRDFLPTIFKAAVRSILS